MKGFAIKIRNCPWIQILYRSTFKSKLNHNYSIVFNKFWYSLFLYNCTINVKRGHVGSVVTHSPPTSGVSGLTPKTYVGKLVVVLPMVSSLQYRTLTSCMYWFPLAIKLPVNLYSVESNFESQ